MRRYLCGVPREHCRGALVTAPHKAGMKVHGSSTEAFNCMTKYLLKQGYTRVGGREFRPPNGGPIRVLTKKSRFGGALRRGKNLAGTQGTRVAFMGGRHAGGTGGVVVSA